MSLAIISAVNFHAIRAVKIHGTSAGQFFGQDADQPLRITWTVVSDGRGVLEELRSAKKRVKLTGSATNIFLPGHCISFSKSKMYQNVVLKLILGTNVMSLYDCMTTGTGATMPIASYDMCQEAKKTVKSRQEVLPSRNSSSLRIRTSFLAEGRRENPLGNWSWFSKCYFSTRQYFIPG